MKVSEKQIRAGRALLNWSQQELGAKAGVHKRLITALENNHRDIREDNLTKIRTTLEQYGVEFIEGDGVRIRPPFIRVLENEDQYPQLLDDIYHTVRDTGGVVKIFGGSEDKPGAEWKDVTKAHVQRLLVCKATEKILVCEDDTEFLAPHDWYRWMPAEKYRSNPIFLYGGKVALVVWGPPDTTIVIENPLLVQSVEALFDMSWEMAIIPPIPGGY